MNSDDQKGLTAPCDTGLTRPLRLQVMLTKDEIEELERRRFTHRMPSRAAAIRELLRRGLGSDS